MSSSFSSLLSNTPSFSKLRPRTSPYPSLLSVRNVPIHRKHINCATPGVLDLLLNPSFHGKMTTQVPPFVYTCVLDCELVIQVKIAVAYQFRANPTKEIHHFGGVRATLVRMKLFPNASGPSVTSLRNRFWNLLDGYKKSGKFMCEPTNDAEVRLLTKGLNYAGMVVHLLSEIQRVEEADRSKPEEVPRITIAGLPSRSPSTHRSYRGSARKATIRGRSYYNSKANDTTNARTKRVFQPSRSSYGRPPPKVQKTDTAKNASATSTPSSPEVIHVPVQIVDNNNNNASPSNQTQTKVATSNTATLAVLPSVSQMRSVIDDPPMCTQSSNADITSRTKSQSSKGSIPNPVDIAPGDTVENVRSSSPSVHTQKKPRTVITPVHTVNLPMTRSSEKTVRSPNQSPSERETSDRNTVGAVKEKKKPSGMTENGTRDWVVDQPRTTRGGTKRKAGCEITDGVAGGVDEPRAKSTSPVPSVCCAPMQLPVSVREPEREQRNDEPQEQASPQVASPANKRVVSQPSPASTPTLSKRVVPPSIPNAPPPVEEWERPLYVKNLVRVSPSKQKSSPRVPQITARMTAPRSPRTMGRTINTPRACVIQPVKHPFPNTAPPKRRPEYANVELCGRKRSRCEAEELRDAVRQRTHDKRRLEIDEERLRIERQSVEKELPWRERSHEHSEKRLKLDEKRYELEVRVARTEVDARKERLAWEKKVALERLQMEKKKTELEMEEIRARMRNEKKALELQVQRVQVEKRKAAAEEKKVEVLQRLEVAGLDAIATFAQRMLDMRRTSS